jgi:hypothetical protein
MQRWLTLGVTSNDTAHWGINFTRLCMNGRWTPSSHSSMFCTPLEWVGRVMIGMLNALKKKDLLRSTFYKFSFLMVFPLFLGRVFRGLRPI